MRFALALIVTLLAAFPALAGPSCMTKHEARSHYGNDWIYWHGPGHCWDNQRGHVRIAKRNETDNRSAARKADKSPSRTAAPEDARLRGHPEANPSMMAQAAVTISIWPDPPSDFTWADRWPNQDRISPDRWLLELVQFGSSGNR
jgi:hypothetical protein